MKKSMETKVVEKAILHNSFLHDCLPKMHIKGATAR